MDTNNFENYISIDHPNVHTYTKYVQEQNTAENKKIFKTHVKKLSKLGRLLSYLPIEDESHSFTRTLYPLKSKNNFGLWPSR